MFGNEHESSPLSLNHYFEIVVGLYDGYVKYEEAEIHRSAIMQDFCDSEIKNNIKKNGRLRPATMFVIITLHNDNNRNGEKFLFHYLRVIVIK